MSVSVQRADGGELSGRRREGGIVLALGLDGCAGGWYAVCLDGKGRFRGAGLFARARAAIAAFTPVVVGVDMPVGLSGDGAREADRAARAYLRGTASSVFNAPPRAVVEAFRAGTVADHEAASAVSLRVAGKGLSRQTWALVRQIDELDGLVHDASMGDVALLEVHPEVSFRLLAAGARLPRKRTWNGLQRRRELLSGVGVELPSRLDGGDAAPVDDVLDAAVAAWTVAGTLTGDRLRSFPPEPRQRDRGRPIAIWARPPPATTP